MRSRLSFYILAIFILVSLFTIAILLFTEASYETQDSSYSSVSNDLVVEEDREPTRSDNGSLDKTTDTSLKAFDNILDALKSANIGFNTPETIGLGKSETITLLLSFKQSTEDLISELVQRNVAGNTESAQIQTSHEVGARLTGTSGLKITAINSEEQILSENNTTEWSWEVEAIKPGSHKLHLTLTALIQVDGDEKRRTIRTFDRLIEVNVDFPHQVASIVDNNKGWIISGILIPIAAWLIRSYWFRRKEQP